MFKRVRKAMVVVFPKDPSKVSEREARGYAAARVEYKSGGPLPASAARLRAHAQQLRAEAAQLECEAFELELVDEQLQRRLAGPWWATPPGVDPQTREVD